MIYQVRILPVVKKQLKGMPTYIVTKLQKWVDSVENEGLDEVRKIPGYHDEALERGTKI